MKTNTPAKRTGIYTAEGGRAYNASEAQMLNRSVMSCMLFEDNFYEDGASVVERIASLIPKVSPETVAAMAIKAREDMKLRHIPLLLCVEMAKHPMHRALVAKTVERVIQRPDELAEILSLYKIRNGHKDLKKLANSLKKGLRNAFRKFDEYQLAKYNRDNEIKLRDVLFLCHPKTQDTKQQKVWDKLVDDKLKTPDTWEVGISGASKEEKAKEWARLLKEDKLGPLALLRNLRNLREANVSEDAIVKALREMKTDRILPFRFIAAASHNPTLESQIENAMFRCLEGVPKLKGKNLIVIDRSGSMNAKLSAKSDMTRFEAAAALAILLREISEKFGCLVFSDTAQVVPARRGFALRDAIANGVETAGTMTDRALVVANAAGYDRIIVITDEQSHQTIRGPNPGSKAYFVNVATEKNGIGYGKWVHVDGFSESIIDFIQTFERETA